MRIILIHVLCILKQGRSSSLPFFCNPIALIYYFNATKVAGVNIILNKMQMYLYLLADSRQKSINATEKEC